MYENYISIFVKECGFQSYQQKYCIMFQMNLIRFVKMFSYVFLYKSLQGLAQVNRTWLSLIVGYDFVFDRKLMKFVIQNIVCTGFIHVSIAPYPMCRFRERNES